MKSMNGITSYCNDHCQNALTKVFPNQYLTRWPGIYTTDTHFLLVPDGVQRMILAAAAAKSLQSCPTVCNPIDSSPPGSSVPGILQARTLEWVAISFSKAIQPIKLCQKSSIHQVSTIKDLEDSWNYQEIFKNSRIERLHILPFSHSPKPR